MTKIRLGSVSLDCADPDVLALFWASLLDGEILFSSEHFVAINVGGAWISALKVENYVPPQWPGGNPPKQIHLDLAVDDLDSSELFALQLGAVKAEFQPQPDDWRVMLDPAGHPFCLTTQIPDL
jgi:hypothetical protein